MSGCDFIVKYIVHILKPEASEIHKTHFKSDLSFSLFPLFNVQNLHFICSLYHPRNIFRLQFTDKRKFSPLDKQSLIVFLQTFNFIYSFIVLLTCFWPGCTQRSLHWPPRTFPLYLYLYFFWQQSERKYPDWNLWILFTLCFGYMQNNENCCGKTYSKVLIFIVRMFYMRYFMWNVTAILLFILVFISPYFITTWRQFLQQVMSKLHWFAEKIQNIL